MLFEDYNINLDKNGMYSCKFKKNNQYYYATLNTEDNPYDNPNIKTFTIFKINLDGVINSNPVFAKDVPVTVKDFINELNAFTKKDSSSVQEIKISRIDSYPEVFNLYLACKFDEAFTEFKKLADSGDGRAMFILGEYYYFGYGKIIEDGKVSKEWMEKSYYAGYYPAKISLYCHYGYFAFGDELEDLVNSDEIAELVEEGDYIAMDELAEAYNDLNDELYLKWKMAAAKEGYWKSKWYIGEYYEETEEDFVEAEKWYLEAANQGCPQAQMYIGDLYKEQLEESKKSKDILDWYTKAAIQNFGPAQAALASYLCSIGKEDSAFSWYLKAAENNDADGQENVGRAFLNGNFGLEKNEVEAVKWFIKASKNGSSFANVQLAKLYKAGCGVQKDLAKAVKLLQEVDYNNEALCELGNCYYNGEGVEVDYDKAVELYSNAIDGENVEALYRLGVCYYNGHGVERIYRKAGNFFAEAADRGYPEAQFEVGRFYYKGEVFPQDYEEAVSWFKKAADQGNVDAQTMLGVCYYKGYGVKSDMREALSWLKKASAQGDKKAQKILETIQNNVSRLAKIIGEIF